MLTFLLTLSAIILCLFYLATNRNRVISEEILNMVKLGESDFGVVVKTLGKKYGPVDVIKAINMLQDHGVIYLEIREKDKDDG
jgi:hypothetical protein